MASLCFHPLALAISPLTWKGADVENISPFRQSDWIFHFAPATLIRHEQSNDISSDVFLRLAVSGIGTVRRRYGF